MSLRIKFLSLLVLLPFVGLLAFLFISYTTFIEDKIADIAQQQFEHLNSVDVVLEATSADLHGTVSRLLSQEGFESLLFVDERGLILQAAQKDFIGKKLSSLLGRQAYEKLAGQSSLEGGFQAIDPSGNNLQINFLVKEVSHAPQPTTTPADVSPEGTSTVEASNANQTETPKANIETVKQILILSTPIKNATRASILFLFKSLSAFLFLISLAVIISILFSNRLTEKLRMLAQAMVAFGKNHEMAPLPEPVGDEVGLMTNRFADMRVKILNFLKEMEVKLKLEAEFSLAGSLQQRFFPEPQSTFGRASIAGFFEPVYSAGGDWWYYFKKDQFLISLIADVTGHGINSAMLTAVSRAVISLVENDFKDTAHTMNLFNRAIFDSAKGELQMTCTLTCLNLETGELKYTVAAHENSYIIPPGANLKVSDLKLLAAPRNHRLGQFKETAYMEMVTQLNPGDTVLLYTDGLIDLVNAAGEKYSEKRMLKSILKAGDVRVSAVTALEVVKTSALEFRSGTELRDDLTFMTIFWGKL